MSGELSTIDSVPTLFTGKSLHGFWIVNWLKVAGNRERLTAIYEEVAPLVASGAISIPVAGEFRLNQICRGASACVQAQRQGDPLSQSVVTG
jgi:NADPH:quinone reductase-like Zn-dependent oxidoreductase